MELVTHLLYLAALFVCSAFFSSAETALFSLSKIEKKRIREKHPYLSKWVMDHLEHPRRTLITILIGNLVVNTLAAAIVTVIAGNYLSPQGLGFVMVLYTVLLILLCEIIPKIVSVRKDVLVSLILAIPLRIFSVLLLPFRYLTRVVTDWVLSFITHGHVEHGDQISEEELKALVKIGEEEGVLDRDERRMLQKLLALGERPVKAIMTPRIDLAAFNLSEPREKHIEMIQRFHFSEFPVYQNTTDNILGVVSVQDYMLNPEVLLQDLLNQPLFVPETKLIDDLLTEFRKKRQNFAVCVDEHGGTAGIVTLEDVLEEIFGEFYDEYAKVENPIRPYGHQEFIVEAKISLVLFNEYFKTSFHSEESTTLAGFILEKLGEVPEKGKVLVMPECELTIHEVMRHRIRSVIVRPAS